MNLRPLLLPAIAALQVASVAAYADDEQPPGLQALDELRNGRNDRDPVRNRFFLKGKRFELAPSLGIVPNNPFARRFTVGAELGYHFSEQLAVLGVFSFAPDLGQRDVKSLTDVLLQRADDDGFAQPFDKVTLGAAFGVQYAPIYGKLNLFGETVANFDFHFFLGVGLVTQTEYLATKNPEYDPACPAADHVAWVTAGTIHTRTRDDHYNYYESCGNGFMRSKVATANDVVGAVRVRHAGRVDTCVWRVDHGVFVEVDGLTMRPSNFQYSTTYGPAWGHRCNTSWIQTHEGSRTGFRVEEGCGLAGSTFLPQRLAAEAPDRANTMRGAPWYDGRSDQRTWSSAGNGRYSSAGDGASLMPAGAFGVCARGTPTLVTDAAAPWGLAGVCAL